MLYTYWICANFSFRDRNKRKRKKSRTFCCCLSSNCGHCCYDEKLMTEKERRMNRKNYVPSNLLCRNKKRIIRLRIHCTTNYIRRINKSNWRTFDFDSWLWNEKKTMILGCLRIEEKKRKLFPSQVFRWNSDSQQDEWHGRIRFRLDKWNRCQPISLCIDNE